MFFWNVLQVYCIFSQVSYKMFCPEAWACFLGFLAFFFPVRSCALQQLLWFTVIHVTSAWISSQQWNPDQVKIPVALVKPSQWAVIRWRFLWNALNVLIQDSQWWDGLCKYLRPYIALITYRTACCTGSSYSSLVINWYRHYRSGF